MNNQNHQLLQQNQNQAIQTFDLFNPSVFDAVQRMAKMYTRSELVPKMYQSATAGDEKAIANTIIALETAQRIGASPLMIMQNMYIVHGQPAWSAKFLTATVNSCGRYNSIKYKWENLGKTKVPNTQTEIDNWQCIAYTTEKGSQEELESVPVSVEMAIKEGWYQKNGSKWQTMPRLMLQYRAVTFWTRAYAPEISMGLKTEDEVYDIVDVQYEEVPVDDKVKEEIKKNANKETISMDGAGEDPEPENNRTPPPANNQQGQQPPQGRTPLF